VDDPNLLRIGTKERDEALRLLGEHFAEGRLPIAEYDERVSRAIEAETRGDVKPLFRDLPAPYPAFLAPPPPALPAPPPAMMYPSYPAYYELSDRHKVAAGVLQIFLPFGIGRFYMGHTGVGVAQLLTAFVGFGIFWCWIDGILLLINGGTDGQGRRLRE
jgi:TM2 domain-containing membrane protein YozV